MDKDIPPLGGVRSKRYTLVIENNTVTKIFEEPDGTGIKRSKNNFHLKTKNKSQTFEKKLDFEGHKLIFLKE